MRSVYAAPFQLPSKFVLEFKSNLRPEENSYEIRTSDGNVILAQGGFSTNTIYKDTITLDEGCYEIQLLDEGSDGLNWWANTAQGTGYFRIKRHDTGAILKTFNPDFGGEVFQQFVVGPVSSVQKPEAIVADLQVYPNPVLDDLEVNVGMTRAAGLEVSVIDLMGKSLMKQSFGPGIHEGLNLRVANLSSGIYLLSVQCEGEVKVRKFVKK